MVVILTIALIMPKVHHQLASLLTRHVRNVTIYWKLTSKARLNYTPIGAETTSF